jgi:hypothetical protein
MIRVIGNADEFWRLRLTRLDTTENFEFEWHDDILYREPRPDQGDEVELWHVEAVRLDDPDVVVRLATCDSQSQAREIQAQIAEDLAGMTKSEFETAFIETAEMGDLGLE